MREGGGRGAGMKYLLVYSFLLVSGHQVDEIPGFLSLPSTTFKCDEIIILSAVEYES